MIFARYAGSITPPRFPSSDKMYDYYTNIVICLEGPLTIIDIFQGHGNDPHGWITLWNFCISNRIDVSL